jgi:rubrerythrin
MGPVEALEIALQKEIEALELYKKMAIEHSTARDVFSFLVNEEQKHKKLIEKKIQELNKY